MTQTDSPDEPSKATANNRGNEWPASLNPEAIGADPIVYRSLLRPAIAMREDRFAEYIEDGTARKMVAFCLSGQADAVVADIEHRILHVRNTLSDEARGFLEFLDEAPMMDREERRKRMKLIAWFEFTNELIV